MPIEPRARRPVSIPVELRVWRLAALPGPRSKKKRMMGHSDSLSTHRLHGDSMSADRQSALSRELTENKGSRIRFFSCQSREDTEKKSIYRTL
jgi:hypothetical protein